MEQIIRQRERGLTVVELLMVIAIIAALTFIGFTTNIFGRRGGMAVAVEQLHESVNEARSAALAGVEDETRRTFDVADLAAKLPLGMRIGSADQLPVRAPIIGKVVFQPQSGLAPNIQTRGLPGQKPTGWGWVILDSPRDRDQIATLIPYQPGPLLMYRFRNGKWELMQSNLH